MISRSKYLMQALISFLRSKQFEALRISAQEELQVKSLPRLEVRASSKRAVLFFPWVRAVN